MRRALLLGALLALCGCPSPPSPPPTYPPPAPGGASCSEACGHLASIGCGADECIALCTPVQLPGYADCLLAAGSCLQANACDTGR